MASVPKVIHDQYKIVALLIGIAKCHDAVRVRIG